MAAGNAPRSCEPRASGRLLGRVHVPIQPPYLEISRQIVLSTGATGHADRSCPLRHPGQTTTGCTRWRQVNIPMKEKWDLYIPFLERTFQMLKPNGMMTYIIPDAYNSNKYSEASHDLFLREATIRRIDFCSGIDIFDAGVHNTILFFSKQFGGASIPLRVLHSAPDVEQFFTDYQILPSRSQREMGHRSSNHKRGSELLDLTTSFYRAFAT